LRYIHSSISFRRTSVDKRVQGGEQEVLRGYSHQSEVERAGERAAKKTEETYSA
jgi:hypothetical protein